MRKNWTVGNFTGLGLYAAVPSALSPQTTTPLYAKAQDAFNTCMANQKVNPMTLTTGVVVDACDYCCAVYAGHIVDPGKFKKWHKARDLCVKYNQC
jgi:hypothetical protein